MIGEAQWEQMAKDQLAELGWVPRNGTDIAPGTGERESWADLEIPSRLVTKLRELNPTVPAEYLQQAAAELLRTRSQDALTENHRLHDWLTRGFRGISWIDTDGVEQSPTIQVVSADPDANDWLVVTQVRVVQGDVERRFDVVLYCNGLPVAIIELKQAGHERATVAAAHAQLATYVRELPMAFRFAVLTVASDGLFARYGTPFTPLHHFAPWNVDDDGRPVGLSTDPDDLESSGTGLEVLLAGLFNLERFGQLWRNFTAYDEGDGGVTKRIAKPHQYFAVTKAVAATVEAVRSNGRAGVVWHTQGSGKSMEMELYAHLVAIRPELLNPTLVVVTDRTELDEQLFSGFKRSLLLPETPVQVADREQLRTELGQRTTGGIYFTTLQKFGRTTAEREAGSAHPRLSDRRNIVVVVDEAHRSHYDDLDGYARHLKDALPHATMIAFTGTPLALEDRNTREVFGDDIDVYDLSRAVEDGATVPVFFEPRLIRVTRADGLSEEQLDAAADELTAGLNDAERARVEQGVAVVNAVYGAPQRIAVLARDVVDHWELRRAAMRGVIGCPGKALVVGGTREICARLYAAVVELRPGWHSEDDTAGRIKVVYSGTPSDVPPVVDHVRRESANSRIKERLRDPDDELEIVIVKDMMLTGYDCQPLHTLYLDRPLKGALLMQTLARVNRTFRGKSDGLLVAYAPLADNLQKALAEYSDVDRDRLPQGRDIAELVTLATELVAQIDALDVGYDWRTQLTERRARGDARAYVAVTNTYVNRLRDPALPGNQVAEGEETVAAAYRRLSGALARAWALTSSDPGVQPLRPAIAFYEEVRVWMAKWDAEDRQARGEPVPEEIGRLLGELIVSAADADHRVLDIYAAAGMPRPSLGDLGPGFVEQVQAAEHPHLAIEALRALVNAESVRATRSNTLRQRAFSERVEEVMRKYTNQQLSSAEVVAELIALAREISAEASRGASFTPPLDDDQLAFYDAVAANESAVDVMGDGVLADIARDLVAVMRRDVRTDWTVRDDVRAKLRTSIKRLLVKHGYPPDRQPDAIRLVMEQMESMAPRYAQDRVR